MNHRIDDYPSVFLIRHSNGKQFGTGFAIHCDEEATWIVTCAHVVKSDTNVSLLVDGKRAEVYANGRSADRKDKIDLALLRVSGLRPNHTWPLNPANRRTEDCEIPGWWEFIKPPKDQVLRGECLKANLCRPFSRTEEGTLIARAWDLEISGDGLLQAGFSGAPVICPATGCVLAVVTTNEESCKKGTAICISHLRDIWPDIPDNLLSPPEQSGLGREHDQAIRALFDQFAGRFCVADIIPVCRQSAAPNLLADLPIGNSLIDSCTWFLDRPQSANGCHALYDVLALLKTRSDKIEAQRIRRSMQHLEDHYRHPRLVISPLPVATQSVEPALVEIVFEPRVTSEDRSYDVHSFLHQPDGRGCQAGPSRDKEDKEAGGRLDPGSTEHIRNYMSKLMDALGDRQDYVCKEIAFLFRLPAELLLHPVEQWPKSLFGILLGRQHAVMVAPRERSNSLLWMEFWDRLASRMCEPLKNVLWYVEQTAWPTSQDEVEDMLFHIERSDCPALIRPPDLNDPLSALTGLIENGVAVACWPRTADAAAGFREIFDGGLDEEILANLPYALRDLRKADLASKEPGPVRNFTLLWDDPSLRRRRLISQGGHFFQGDT